MCPSLSGREVLLVGIFGEALEVAQSLEVSLSKSISGTATEFACAETQKSRNLFCGQGKKLASEF